MNETRYEGSCHCGAVKLEVSMTPPEKAFACNCSICRRVGWLLAFVKDSEVKHIPEAVSDYQIGKKRAHHYFCKTCGCRVYSKGTDANGVSTMAVNLRCIDGIDATQLPVETFDGASL